MKLNINDPNYNSIIVLLKKYLINYPQQSVSQRRLCAELIDIVPKQKCLVRNICVLFEFSTLCELVKKARVSDDIAQSLHKVMYEAENIYGLSFFHFKPVLILLLKSLGCTNKYIFYYTDCIGADNTSVMIKQSQEMIINLNKEIDSLSEEVKNNIQRNMESDIVRINLEQSISATKYWEERALLAENEVAQIQCANYDRNKSKIQYSNLINEGIVIKNDGTVIDLRTKLRWMRYTLGCRWNNGQITGQPIVFDTSYLHSKFTKHDLKIFIKQFNKNYFLINRRWRLPTKDEFRFIFSFDHIADEIFSTLPHGNYIDSRYFKTGGTVRWGSHFQYKSWSDSFYVILCLDVSIKGLLQSGIKWPWASNNFNDIP